MPKIDSASYAGGPSAITVHVPENQALADLLTGTGCAAERLIGSLASAAQPGNGAGTSVTFNGGDLWHAAEGLTALLARARAEGHAAAGELEELMRQIGDQIPGRPLAEPDTAEPELVAEPEPARAPRKPPVPPRPPAPRAAE